MQPLDLGNYGGGLKINTADCGAALPNVRCVTSANAVGQPEPGSLAFVELRRRRRVLLRPRLDAEHLGLQAEDRQLRDRRSPTGRFPDQDGVIRRTVNVSLPIQGDGGSVKGLEVGAKLAFSDIMPDAGLLSNFGVDTNYTYSPSHESRLDLDGEKLPVPTTPSTSSTWSAGIRTTSCRPASPTTTAPTAWHDGRRRQHPDLQDSRRAMWT
jgi:hypothetical protein